MRQVVVATHGHCFDGLCSAVMFTHLLRELHRGEPLAFAYRAQGYQPGSSGVDPAVLSGDINAILDFRFSASPRVSWYFDHHVSAFGAPTDRDCYEEHLHSAKSADRRRMFHDGAYGSCTKLIADVSSQTFGVELAQFSELVRWADIIDSAAFPSATMAVSRAEPVLHLMAVVERHCNDAFLQAMVPRLLEEPLEHVARSREVQEAYAPLADQQTEFIDLVKRHAEAREAAVVVDLSAVEVESAAKFVTYALWPESAYSVMLTRSPSKCKISVGYNPWSGVPRRHNIAAICERHGGGGHPVVGAISLPPDRLHDAQKLLHAIGEELAKP